MSTFFMFGKYSSDAVKEIHPERTRKAMKIIKALGVLCRNLVLTYFEETLQRRIIEGMLEKLIPGGILVVGIHESLPEGLLNVIPYGTTRGIYQKRPIP